MGIISKSVAHACSGGARGLLRPNDQEYGKGVVKFLPRSRESRDVRFRIQGTLLGFRAYYKENGHKERFGLDLARF